MRAWVPMLRDVIAQVLQLYDAADRERVIFRSISDRQWGLIEGRVVRLFSHRIWDDPNEEVVSKLKVNAAEQIRGLLASQGLTVRLDIGGRRSLGGFDYSGCRPPWL